MKTMVLDLLKKRWVQLSLALLLGVTIGVVFYPSSRTEERERVELLESKISELEKSSLEKDSKISELSSSLEEVTDEFSSYRKSASERIESLVTENSHLKTSSKKSKYKLVKPDGTVIEKEFEESETEETKTVIAEVRREFDEKIESIENKWKKIHQERVEKIREDYEKRLKEKKTEIEVVEKIVEKEKIVEVNSKKFKVEGGYSTDNKGYTHLSYLLWGPILVGGGFSLDFDGKNPEGRLGLGIEF